MAIESTKTLVECRQRLKEKLDGCFARNDDPNPQKRFARRGVTREIFEEDRLEHFLMLLYHDSNDVIDRVVSASLRSIAKKIRGSEDSPERYNNVLATLVYSQCTNQCLIKFIEDLVHERDSSLVSDGDLPLAKSKACEAFGNSDGPNFWEHQFLFCPVILKERDEVVYVGHKQSCPRPFLGDPEKIGQGAYAIVYKVRIERGHLEYDKGANDRNEYAMKEYIGYDAEAKKSFKAERTTIKEFIQCAKSHDNIATTKASLEWGNTYSLFFDLAKCNLWEYLEKDTDTVKNLEGKGKMFSQTIGLAGALAYLHEELYLTSTNEQLQCYHLDLKPQNILVFETNGKESWKISDFGISQIKRIKPGESQSDSQHHISFLDKIFQSKQPDKDLSSGIDNSRYGGTYAAPEAKEKSDTVTRKTDVWSLACVITLVLTYFYDQSEGILQFQKSRSKDRSHDWFFDSKALKAGSETREILHASVLDWFHILNAAASRRDKSEAKVTRMATGLLKDEMFLRSQDARISAKEVEKKLRKIQLSFTELPGNLPEQITPKPPMWPFGILHRPSHNKGSHKNKSIQESWPFDVPLAPGRCKFSADGMYLGIASNSVIYTKSISSVQQGEAGTHFPSPKNKQWAHFSIGSKYLCAVVDSEYFGLSYLPLSTEDNADRYDAYTNVKCRIRKVLISPNDSFTAFVLENPQEGRKTLRVSLYHTHDLCDLPASASSEAIVGTQPSSSISRSSTIAISQEDLFQKDIIRWSRDSELPIGALIADIKFSSDSNTLIGITEFFNQQGTQVKQYEAITWNVNKGRRISTIRNHTTGFDDMGQSWAIDTFAVLATQPAFASISKKRLRWGTYDPPEYKIASKIMNDEILDILLTDEEDELILLGRSNGKAAIKAFRVSTSKIKGLESLGRGVPIGSKSNEYSRTTDCCCLSEKDEKLVILVAIIRPNRSEGRLYEVMLDLITRNHSKIMPSGFCFAFCS